MMEQQKEYWQKRTAVLLDVRRLAEHCVRLQEELAQLHETHEAQTRELDALRSETPPIRSLLAVAERTLREKKREILTHLRAIVHHTGDHARLARMEKSLGEAACSPESILSLSESVADELRSLYPTAPVSERGGERRERRMDWSAYRFQKPRAGA